MPDPAFLPGLELSRRFYHEAVRPLLAGAGTTPPDGAGTTPPDGARLIHSAALVGPGSEVLGFDTERSTDHDWGPRLQLFLRPDDLRRHGAELGRLLDRGLPRTFAGRPTRFATTRDGRVRHRIEVTDLDTWFAGRLGFDPRQGVDLFDWLTTPTQLLAEATAGAVFADGLGELAAARDRLAWYPPDVWRYVLACQWQRVGQEEHLVGRCGEVGDDAGSAVLAARLVRDLMRLCLLVGRRWPPYAKWLGSAFGRLPDAYRVAPHLAAALVARDWPAREAALCRASLAAAELTNALGLAEPVDPRPRPFFDRPFQVLAAGRFTGALLAAVTDPRVRALPVVGAVDQVVDNTDVLGDPRRARAAGRAALTADQPPARP